MATQLESGQILLDQEEQLLCREASESLRVAGLLKVDLRSPISPLEHAMLVIRRACLVNDTETVARACALMESRSRAMN